MTKPPALPAASSRSASWREETTIAAQRSSFEKLQRERAKKTKAAAKRERRFDKDAGLAGGDADQAAPDHGHELPAARLLELVEQLHNQYESKQIGYDEFEEKKADLLARLPID